MDWLMALRPLFESLRSFRDEDRRRHLEKSNFLGALEKVKPTLNLRDPDDPRKMLDPDQEAALSFETVLG